MLDFVNVEGRVGSDVVARAVERMGVVVERVRPVARHNLSLHAVDGHVHEAQLRVVVDLLLPVEHHALGGVAAALAHIVARRHEHAARPAGGIEHGAAIGLYHVHDHAHERLWREEHAVIACHGGGELAEEVLIDAPDDVVAVLVEGGVVEDADDAAQKFVAQLGVGVGQHAAQGGVHRRDARHGLVDSPARVGAVREVEQVVVARGLGQEHRALRGVVRGLLGRFASRERCALGVYLRIRALEAPPGVAQEDEAQHGHAVLLARQLGVGAQIVRRLPKLALEFADVCHGLAFLPGWCVVGRRLALGEQSRRRRGSSPPLDDDVHVREYARRSSPKILPERKPPTPNLNPRRGSPGSRIAAPAAGIIRPASRSKWDNPCKVRMERSSA